MSRRRVKTSVIQYDVEADAYFWTQESGEWPFTPSWHALGGDGWGAVQAGDQPPRQVWPSGYSI